MSAHGQTIESQFELLNRLACCSCFRVFPLPWCGDSEDATRTDRAGLGLPYVMLLALLAPGECRLPQTSCSCGWFSELLRRALASCADHPREVDVQCDTRPPQALPAPAEPAGHRLTPHEVRLLKLLVEGHRYKTAAAELRVSPHTVSFHLRRLYQKLDVHSKSEAVSKALRYGLVQTHQCAIQTSGASPAAASAPNRQRLRLPVARSDSE